MQEAFLSIMYETEGIAYIFWYQDVAKDVIESLLCQFLQNSSSVLTMMFVFGQTDIMKFKTKAKTCRFIFTSKYFTNVCMYTDLLASSVYTEQVNKGYNKRYKLYR